MKRFRKINVISEAVGAETNHIETINTSILQNRILILTN
jgi:hypothetical protein